MLKIKNCLILCGGEGTRIKNLIPNTHKCLIPINNIPFIQYIIEKFDKFIITLCVCNRKEQYFEAYKDNKTIKFSEEVIPLGTGGAIINAINSLDDEYIIVTNGDSYCDFDLNAFYNYFKETNYDLYIVATLNYSNISDYGMIRIDKNNKILSFTEKPSKAFGEFYQNCGTYIIKKKLLDKYSIERKSFEEDMLPELIKNNNCYIYKTNKRVYDIGTPDRVEMASEYFKSKI